MRYFIAGAVAAGALAVAVQFAGPAPVTPPHRCFEDEVIVAVIGEWNTGGFKNTGEMIGQTTCVTVDDYRWVSP